MFERNEFYNRLAMSDGRWPLADFISTLAF